MTVPKWWQVRTDSQPYQFTKPKDFLACKMQIIPVVWWTPKSDQKCSLALVGSPKAMNISPPPQLPPVLMAELWLTLVMGKWIADNYIL